MQESAPEAPNLDSPTVLHVFDHGVPLQSGYATRSRAILEAQRARGWKTLQVTGTRHQHPSAIEALQKGVGYEDVGGLTFHRTAPGFMSRLPLLHHADVVRSLEKRIASIVKAHRPDFLHAHSPVLGGLAALRVAARHRIPFVYEVRAFWEDAAVDHGTTTRGSPRYRMTRSLETYVVRRAQAVVCICEGLRRDLVARDVPAERVFVVGNAIDPSRFKVGEARDPELARELGIGDGPVLGFLGSFYAYEGIDLLVDAMPRIAEEIPGVQLLLVGGGPQDERLRQRVREAGLEQVVRFAGRVPPETVVRYAALADVHVFPRRSIRLTELVTPLKPLEAMAQGDLVVASDVGGHRELITDGQTGYLFRAGDVGELAAATIRALREADAGEQIRRAALEFVRRERTWQATTSVYVQAYAAARAELGEHAAARKAD